MIVTDYLIWFYMDLKILLHDIAGERCPIKA